MAGDDLVAGVDVVSTNADADPDAGSHRVVLHVRDHLLGLALDDPSSDLSCIVYVYGS